MIRLDKLYFLIHGFCYADMAYHAAPGGIGSGREPYLDREKDCARRWRSRLHDLSPAEGLVIIPWCGKTGGPVSEFNTLARSVLKDRCFVLDCPDCHAPQFWAEGSGDFSQAVLTELGSALVGQGMRWNKEELETALHCAACCRQLHVLLAERGYSFDPGSLSAEAWGASFEGCVTKCTLSIRRMLHLSNGIEINWEMTVPDTSFLLSATEMECVLLDGGLRLFLFKAGGQGIGLYVHAAHSLADGVAFVGLRCDPEKVTVRSKQGIRLWPRPEPYVLRDVPFGYHEPPQKVVTFADGRLHVPISAGFVYRLAKAPAFVFSPPEMPYADFRDMLRSAVRMETEHCTCHASPESSSPITPTTS